MALKTIPRFFKLVPFALSLIAAVLIILVLVAGSSPAALPNLYLLKARLYSSPTSHTPSRLLLTNGQVDTSALRVPAKLSGSQYLVDLSALTTTDLTGPSQTPSTLGIAPLYRVYVFTCCSPTTCTAPLVGPSFDPAHNLRLEATSLGSPAESLEDVLRLYRVTSPLLGVMLILAFVFVLGAPSVALLGRKFRSAGWVALVVHCLATVCLLVACVVGHIGMVRLRDGMDADLGSVGVRAYSGGLLYPAWAALPPCLLNAVLAFASIGRSRGAEEREKEQQRASEEQEAPAETDTSTRTEQAPPPQIRETWPPVDTGVRRVRIRNTLHEDLSEGWLRESVLGSMDKHKNRRYTGDGTGVGGGGAQAFYAVHRKPVRMPDYEN